MRLRIIVLFGNTPLLGNERANIETLRQLKDRGAEVLFLVRREYAGEIHAELERLGLSYRFCPYFDTIRHGVGPWVWLRNLWGIVAGSALLLWLWASWRPTHIHLGSTAWALNFWPALILTRTPLIFRAGDVPARHHRVWQAVWDYVARRASVFVCDSHFIKRSVVALGAPERRCQVVYAPAPDRTQSDDAETATYDRISGRITILYVGQLSAEKGVDRLVAAIRSLLMEKKARLILVGNYAWQNPFAKELIEEVREARLSSDIVFTGFVQDIGRLYAIADLHVAPSICLEAYGLTVIEAKTHGVPSVVFPSGGLTETVMHGREGWVCERPDTSCLIDAIRFYIDNPDVLPSQGAAARASLTERLRVQDFGDRWHEIYEAAALD